MDSPGNILFIYVYSATEIFEIPHPYICILLLCLGHCAQYCTYTTIEHNSRDIIHVETVDKRQTNRNSVVMEKEGFVRTMDALLPEIPVKVVTDAHRQISALLS